MRLDLRQIWPNIELKQITIFPVVVAQMVERLLLTSEVSSSNPVIRKNYIEPFFTVNSIEMTKIKKKRLGRAIKTISTYVKVACSLETFDTNVSLTNDAPFHGQLKCLQIASLQFAPILIIYL